MINNFSDIEKKDDLGSEIVRIEAWDDEVTIRKMNGHEGDKFGTRLIKASKNDNLLVGLRTEMIAACLINSDGEKIVSKGQVSKLGDKSSQALEELFKACMKINGLSEEEAKENEKN